MKALLQKDLYQLRAYCKSYLLICAVFFCISLAGEGVDIHCPKRNWKNYAVCPVEVAFR